MATKTRLQLKNDIDDLCDQAGCNDKVRGIHVAQYVDRRWNPHPPQAFVNWWGGKARLEAEKIMQRAWTPIDSTRAYNCEAIRELYLRR